MHVESFPPVATNKALALILGSMPGVESLRQNQYYAHPRNLFWPIMSELFDADIDTYAARVHLIRSNGLALWDVLQFCYREGSLDTKIKDSSIVVNDFAGFLAAHPHITHVFFNGTKAEREFMKRVKPHLPEKFAHLQYHRLPSTSPAMAMLKIKDKMKLWAEVREALKRKG